MEEIHPSSYKRKKRSGKKEEDLSAFETTEVIEYKLTGADRNCPDCNTKYKVVTKETVKRLKFVPARFEVAEEVTYVYSCPKCGAMKRPEKAPSLLKGSVATPSLAAGIMNASMWAACPLRVRNGNSPVTTEPFHKDHGELDHPVCGPVSAAAL